MSITEPYNKAGCTPIQLTAPTYQAVRYVNYDIGGDYLFKKKHEENKRELIRQRSAFKLFYNKPQFVVTKTKNDFLAEVKEVSERVNKFKGLNNNLLT